MNFQKFCLENNVSNVALPKITSDLDQLELAEIRTMIRYIFKSFSIEFFLFLNIKYSEEDEFKIMKEFQFCNGWPSRCFKDHQNN